MHFQDSLLCKWKQGEKRNCPYHGTCDNHEMIAKAGYNCKEDLIAAALESKLIVTTLK